MGEKSIRPVLQQPGFYQTVLPVNGLKILKGPGIYFFTKKKKIAERLNQNPDGMTTQ
jgi:hypothetical protein